MWFSIPEISILSRKKFNEVMYNILCKFRIEMFKIKVYPPMMFKTITIKQGEPTYKNT